MSENTPMELKGHVMDEKDMKATGSKSKDMMEVETNDRTRSDHEGQTWKVPGLFALRSLPIEQKKEAKEARKGIGRRRGKKKVERPGWSEGVDEDDKEKEYSESGGS